MCKFLTKFGIYAGGRFLKMAFHGHFVLRVPYREMDWVGVNTEQDKKNKISL